MSIPKEKVVKKPKEEKPEPEAIEPLEGDLDGKGNPDGKNEPVLQDLFKTQIGKDALTKAGKASVDYTKWKTENFKPMKPVVIKLFERCSIDIDERRMTAEECYSKAKAQAVEQGSVYIPPALRTKTKQAFLEAKYPPVKFS